ncbi:MAG: anti-sigma factor [Herpetosiphonaceae bacterium]|nr:anti-sigma factor [Herpetosiphonaceae bacterium]
MEHTMTDPLAPPLSAPDEQALITLLEQVRVEPTSRFYRRMAAAPWKQNPDSSWRTPMRTRSPLSILRRPLFAGLATIAIIAGLLAVPSVRALANQFLQVFRVKQVLFVPTDLNHLAQTKGDVLRSFDKRALFTTPPTVINHPAPARTVGSLNAASQSVGFTAQQLHTFPSTPTSTEIRVYDHMVGRFQVNVPVARQLLTALDVHDVTLPDALGTTPTTIDVPPSLHTTYAGAGYTLQLHQGVSPSATLPDGVDLSQLGRAMLRLSGMDAAQADALSKQVDWKSTFVFPFPANTNNIHPVTIGGGQGLLMGSPHGQESAKAGSKPSTDTGAHWQLLWQHADRFYLLEGSGQLTEVDIVAAANSVR